MKVISVKGNKVTFDFSEIEYNLLLTNGLQKWIDKEFGANKVKVIPVSKGYRANKKIEKFELGDRFAKECITISVNEALKEMIKRKENEQINKS